MINKRSVLLSLAIAWFLIGCFLAYGSVGIGAQQQPATIQLPQAGQTESATSISISKIEIEASAAGFADSTFTINGYVGKPLAGSVDPVTGFNNFDPFENRTLFSSKLGSLKLALQKPVQDGDVTQQEVDQFFTDAIAQYVGLNALATRGLDLFSRAKLKVNYPTTPVLRPKR